MLSRADVTRVELVLNRKPANVTVVFRAAGGATGSGAAAADWAAAVALPAGIRYEVYHKRTDQLRVKDDRIVDYVLRIDDHKRRSVEAFRSLNYQVVAAGDSYNDLSMIRAANAGALFHAPQNVIDENPDLPAFDSYDELRAWIDSTDPSPGT